ncbi:hypothetical protein BDN72DRAFT_307419 [Pluteus cervinus]|uniref:Uncharacterized protein n=1 Tax=Pluteus cervinus TaxID=181527 RepID=A0ACD3ADP2_9AGAR|nr:hypothetical protein BDN72DRAFT_307419 [Pluteus cervinus]
MLRRLLCPSTRGFLACGVEGVGLHVAIALENLVGRRKVSGRVHRGSDNPGTCVSSRGTAGYCLHGKRPALNTAQEVTD